MSEPAFDLDMFDMNAHLRELITARIDSHERSLQREIGASELGTPCVRKLALKLAMQEGLVEPVPEQTKDDKWRATVGTAVHAWLADMLRAENERYRREWHDGAMKPCGHAWCDPDCGHRDRYLIEHHTPVGTINGVPVPGNLDVYDRLSKTLVDWKIPGPTAIKNYRAARDPGDEYRVQVQAYGRGLARVTPVEDVRYVGIMFLPANGELKQAWYWETEFDPEVGKAAFARARDIQNLIREEGLAVIPKLKTTDDHCGHCPFFAPETRDPEHECPGDPSLIANADTFADLFPKGAP